MYSFHIRIVDVNQSPCRVWEVFDENEEEPTRKFLFDKLNEIHPKAARLVKDDWIWLKFKEINVGQSESKIARFTSEEHALSYVIYTKV